MSEGNHYYKRNPTLNDMVHCLVGVIPAHQIAVLSNTDGAIVKMREIRKEASNLGGYELGLTRILGNKHIKDGRKKITLKFC